MSSIRNEKKKMIIARLDIQVAIFGFLLTLCATVITSMIFWNITFNLMITSLDERVYALYDSLEDTLDSSTFEYINTPEDMEDELYQESKDLMLQLKNASGVMYFYTAKEDVDGTFIYVIDGLEDDEDFRYPGDAIEEEIISDMELALSGVEVVPNEIMKTDWGDIFVAYLPVHDEAGDVIGVVGIEFDASEIYNHYQKIWVIAPIIIMILSMLSLVVSVILFRRITNPLYKDLANKDLPTGLKNRNAFEIDMHNLTAREQMDQVGLIMMDLNGLKKINDKFGHHMGDDYISFVADCINRELKDGMSGYRIGGDEFIVIAKNTNKAALVEFVDICSALVANQDAYPKMKFSISCGCTMYDSVCDDDLEDTYKRADELMYLNKKRMYKELR